MRFRVLRGGPARRFRFGRRNVAAPPTPAAPFDPRRAALDNPYGRYYSQPRLLEELPRRDAAARGKA